MQSLLRSGQEKKETKNSQQRKSLQDYPILLHVVVSVKISSFSFDAAVHALIAFIAFNSVPTPLRLLCEQLTHQGWLKRMRRLCLLLEYNILGDPGQIVR